MDKINNYWNIFASTGTIDDYMKYKKLDKINKTESVLESSSINNNSNIFK